MLFILSFGTTEFRAEEGKELHDNQVMVEVRGAEYAASS